MVGDPNDVIEAGGPAGSRRWIGIAVLAALVVVPVVSLLVSRDPGLPPVPDPRATVSGTVSTPVAAATPTNVLYPKPRSKGDRKILDVVFPDGTKAEITYPADLRLAELGVRPARGGWLDGYFSLYRELTVPPGGHEEVSQGGPMIRELAGNSTLWQAASPTEGQVMLFDFTPWYVTLRDQKNGMTFEQRQLWAKNLHGEVTKDGYLVLEGSSPVRLAEPGQIFRGGIAGPRLWFGGFGGPLVVVAPMPHCDTASIGPIEAGQGVSKSVCRNGVYVAASGERGVVERVIAEVRGKLVR
ncbi:hypothetical protein [Streptosporangium saharense]|uniref:Uncharacterized protein n=1 Tax=Streptosporangium saharense TaxID=1706840 RepID=A0A7W7QS62_9ACTN|nr:hypothetical protein [Streptosporangium saharense]MBB4918787.1 hypothetical protein [Streptosporangium saharense]